MKWNKDKDVFALMCGHGTQLNGKWDPGCAYGNYTEAGLMLKITKVAARYLRRSGVKVLTDADTNNSRNMVSCVALAAKKKARRYMSIHCDYKLATAGVAPLFVSKAGKEMATMIGKYVAKKMGMKWKGAFRRTDLYELNKPDCVSVIFETGSIKADLKKLKDYRAYGEALARGICKYIGVDFKKHSNVYYARKHMKNVQEKMKALGFNYKGSKKYLADTWEGAKKKKTSNCAMAVSYALQNAHIFDKGEYFYINGDAVVTKNGLTLDELNKKATITHPHTTPKKAKLEKGDICGYKDPPHTMMLAGWAENGQPKWFSIGPKDIRAGKAHIKPTYNNKIISTLIRIKK